MPPKRISMKVKRFCFLIKNFRVFNCLQKIVMFFCCFFSSLPLLVAHEHQENVGILTLNRLVDQVLQHNPNLPAVRARIKAAAIAVPRVQILDDPQFTIATMDNPLQESTTFMPQVQFEISQMLPTSGKLWAKGLVAQKAFEATKTEEITTIRELILQVKKTYFQLLLNHIALKINAQNQKIVNGMIGAALTLYRSGKGAQEEILKAQVELQMIKNERLTLESEQEAIKAMINVLLNNPQTGCFDPPEERFHKQLTFSFQELEKLALQKRSELQGMLAMVEEQRAMARLAQQGYYPDTMVSFMYQRARHDHEDAWGASISINLPLWAASKQKREVHEAHAKTLAQQNTLYSMQAMIRGRIKELLAKLSTTDKQIELYRDNIIPKILQTLVSSQAKYRVGKGNFIFLLDTRRQLQNAQLEYYRARIEREILLAELERAVGLQLEEFAQIKK